VEEFDAFLATPDLGPSPVPESDRQYKRCPEATERDDVPKGTLVRHDNWAESVVYSGTKRNFVVYLPPVSKSEELAVMCVIDGFAHLNYAKLPTILDNLLHEGRIPPTMAIFLQPGWSELEGSLAMSDRDPYPSGYAGFVRRCMEFDAPTDDYARFLQNEILPWVTNEHGVRLTSDPARRVVAGQSSGGVCALWCAWHHPEWFGSLLSAR
jgi:enterochelin esterase family protein